MFVDFQGAALAEGDRIRPIAWGDGIPLSLCGVPATIVGFGRNPAARSL